MSLAVLGVIPARLASTRLPRKVLRDIGGRPLIAWVYEAARPWATSHTRSVPEACSGEVSTAGMP
jgi:CMP-2-keto-3-deoxyoctulosonic acid synthetase